MNGFAKLTMRDSGLPIHISPRHVEQVRLDPENYATAIYLSGKNSPIVVLEKLDVVMRALQGLPEMDSVVVEADFRQAAPAPVEAVPLEEPATAAMPETPIALEPDGARVEAKRARKAAPKKKHKAPAKPQKAVRAPAPAEAPGSWLLSNR